MDIPLSPPLSSLPPPCTFTSNPIPPSVLFTLDDWARHSSFQYPAYSMGMHKDTESQATSTAKAKASAPAIAAPAAAPHNVEPLTRQYQAKPSPQQPSSTPSSSSSQSELPPAAIGAHLPKVKPLPTPKKTRQPKQSAPQPAFHRNYSALSRYEHRQYILLRPKADKGELGEQEEKDFRRLHEQVIQEQQEYRRFKQQMAPNCNICLSIKSGEIQEVEHRCNNHLFMFRGVESVVRSLLLHMRFRKLHYPPHYCAAGIPAIGVSATEGISMQKVPGTAHAIGTPPAFKMHNCIQGVCTPWHYIDPNISPYRIVGCSMPQYKCPKSLQVPVLSADRAALDFCVSHNATFVLSSSSFMALAMLLVMPQRPLTIPFKVIDEGGQRRVLLDKPLLQESYTYRELNARYYKAALVADCIVDAKESPSDRDGIPEEINLMYDLFELGSHRVAIRRRHHGIEKEPADAVYVRSKTEYNNRGFDMQMDGGRWLEFERITDAEFLQYYFSLLIRPSAKLVVGRINVYNSTLIRVDRFTLQSLENYIKAQRALRQPEMCLAVVDSILTALQGLSEGSYLLKHTSGGEGVTILKSCEKEEATFDLHEACDRAGQMDKETLFFIESSDELLNQDKIPNTFPLPSGIREFSWANAANKRKVNRDVNYNISLFFFHMDSHHVVPLTREQVQAYAQQNNLPDPRPAVTPPPASAQRRKRQRKESPAPPQASPTTESAPMDEDNADAPKDDGGRPRSRSRSRSPVLPDNELSLSDEECNDTDFSEMSLGFY